MTHNQLILCKMLSSAIRNSSFDEKYDGIEWRELFKLAKEHQVISLVYPIVKDMYTRKMGPDEKILALWRDVALKSGIKQKNYNNDIEKIIAAFEVSKISVIILKGAVLRSFYVNPLFRTMTDMDLLIREDNFDHAFEVMKALGYRKESYDYRHVLFSKEGHIPVEIHTKLAKEKFSLKANEWEESLWHNAIRVNIGSISTLTLSLEDHLLYLFIHMANHLVSAGFGLRQLCDIVSLAEKNQINWDLFLSKVRNQDLYQFVNAIFKVNSVLLDSESFQLPETDEADQTYINNLVEDIVSGGVFGKTKLERTISGSYISNMAKKEGYKLPNKFSRVLFFILPPYRVMKYKYTYLKSFPFFLPIAWLQRLIFNIFRKDKFFSKKSDFHALRRSQAVYEERYKLLKWLDLL